MEKKWEKLGVEFVKSETSAVVYVDVDHTGMDRMPCLAFHRILTFKDADGNEHRIEISRSAYIGITDDDEKLEERIKAMLKQLDEDVREKFVQRLNRINDLANAIEVIYNIPVEVQVRFADDC